MCENRKYWIDSICQHDGIFGMLSIDHLIRKTMNTPNTANKDIKQDSKSMDEKRCGLFPFQLPQSVYNGSSSLSLSRSTLDEYLFTTHQTKLNHTLSVTLNSKYRDNIIMFSCEQACRKMLSIHFRRSIANNIFFGNKLISYSIHRWWSLNAVCCFQSKYAPSTFQRSASIQGLSN